MRRRCRLTLRIVGMAIRELGIGNSAAGSSKLGGAVCSVFDNILCADRMQRLSTRALHPRVESRSGRTCGLTIKSAASEQSSTPPIKDDIEDQIPSSTPCAPCSTRCGAVGSRRRKKGALGHGNVGAGCLQAQRPDHRPAARHLCQSECAARGARAISMPSQRRWTAARRCASPRLGGAVAGRPIAIRFIDNRNQATAREQP